MKTIGLAGGSGTGKSTIAAHIASRHHGVHIDADQVAHRVLEEPAVIGEIRREFGAGVIDIDGSVNRRRLGVYVFGDAGRDRHPRVTEIVGAGRTLNLDFTSNSVVRTGTRADPPARTACGAGHAGEPAAFPSPLTAAGLV